MHFYTIHNRQGNLFTPYSLTIAWGASMDSGREKLIILESRKELDDRIRRVLHRRLSEGYRVLYSYFRQDERRYARSAAVDDTDRIASAL